MKIKFIDLKMSTMKINFCWRVENIYRFEVCPTCCHGQVIKTLSSNAQKAHIVICNWINKLARVLSIMLYAIFFLIQKETCTCKSLPLYHSVTWLQHHKLLCNPLKAKVHINAPTMHIIMLIIIYNITSGCVTSFYNALGRKKSSGLKKSNGIFWVPWVFRWDIALH